MESYTRNITQAIVPSDEEISRGKRVMDEMFELFKNKSKFKIDRCELVGSTAKKTAIKGHIDFDCVILVNQQGSISIKEIVNHFEDLLLRNYQLQRGDVTKNPRQDPRTLQFNLKGVDFDVCVAINEATNHNNGTRAYHQQANHVIQQLENMTGKQRAASMYQLSPGLSYTSVEFMKKQSSFAHEIARLAKYWNKTLKLSSYVSGRSSIVELIGVAAAKQEEANSFSRSYLNAFRIFLQKVRDIQNMRIEFPEAQKNRIQYLRAPYIIDPANPYHNYLNGVKDEALVALSKFARETLRRIDQASYSQQYGNIFDAQSA